MELNPGELAKLVFRDMNGDEASRVLPVVSKSMSDDSSMESANFLFLSVSIALFTIASPVPRDAGGGDATMDASADSEFVESGDDGFCLMVLGGSSRDSGVSQNCFRMPRS